MLEPPPAETPSAPGPSPKRLARWGLSVGLFVLVVGLTARQWEAARLVALHPQPGWLAVAGVALAAHFVLSAEAWRRWLALLGAPIAFGDAFRVLFLSNVAKYLPGGGWNYLDRALRLRVLGVDAATGAGSMALDVACQLASALIVGQLVLGAARAPGALGVGPVVAVGLVAAMHPRVLGAAFALAGRVRGRPFPRLSIGYRAILMQLALYVLAWGTLGTGFAALAAGLLPTPPDAAAAIALVGAFPLAWAAGTLALFFPAGLGVREGALALLLAPVVAAPWPMALAVAARLWLLLGETAAFALAALGPGGVRAGAPMGTKDP